MANSLLDFVMSVVRDPDTAARFAADPDQTLLEANLPNVTSADVDALIPMVSESLSSTVPAVPMDGGVGELAGNVWSSGAATAAFDAFGDRVPAEAFDEATGTELISDPGAGVQSGLDVLADAGIPGVAGADDPALQFDTPVIDELPVDEIPVDVLPAGGDWDDTITEVDDLDSNASGFDVF